MSSADAIQERRCSPQVAAACPVCLAVCFACSPVCLSVCLSVRMSVCLARLPACLLACLAVCLRFPRTSQSTVVRQWPCTSVHITR